MWKQHHSAALILIILVAGVTLAIALRPRPPWTEGEVAVLRSLSLAGLPPPPPDPSNRFADDPRAAALGARLFFETRLSADGTVACATCHVPTQQFQDGKPLGEGVGTATRRTMPLAGAAYSPWLFWDGRKDSLWAQALGPLESPVEHGGTRVQYARVIRGRYRAEYEALFGPLPDLSDTGRFPEAAGPVAAPAARAAWEAMAPADRDAVTLVYANIGKAIGAFERQLPPSPSRFDAYVEALLLSDVAAMRAALSPDEEAGLRLFVGKGRCVTCHSGPLLTDNGFHNTGVPATPGVAADAGRATGLALAQADEFNCLSRYSDARPADCAALRAAKAEPDSQLGQFKVPSLRGVAGRAPYMHGGQLATLQSVLDHYKHAPAAPAGRSELQPLSLSERELAQLEAFLHSLGGLSQPSAACLGCHPRTPPAGALAAESGRP